MFLTNLYYNSINRAQIVSLKVMQEDPCTSPCPQSGTKSWSTKTSSKHWTLSGDIIQTIFFFFAEIVHRGPKVPEARAPTRGRTSNCGFPKSKFVAAIRAWKTGLAKIFVSPIFGGLIRVPRAGVPRSFRLYLAGVQKFCLERWIREIFENFSKA